MPEHGSRHCPHEINPRSGLIIGLTGCGMCFERVTNFFDRCAEWCEYNRPQPQPNPQTPGLPSKIPRSSLPRPTPGRFASGCTFGFVGYCLCDWEQDDVSKEMGIE